MSNRLLLELLAESLLIPTMAILVSQVARKNAAVRHGICICALFGLLICPVVTFLIDRSGITTLAIHSKAEAVPIQPRETIRWEEISSPELAHQNPAPPSFSFATVCFTIWAAGAVFCFLKLLQGFRQITRLRRSAMALDPASFGSVGAALADGKQGSASQVLTTLEPLAGPIVVGVLRPRVLLPNSLLDSLSEAELRHVLIHEFAHIRRRDPIVGLAQRIVEALFWPNPFVHWLNRTLVRAREEACDNSVLQDTDVAAYARTLLAIAERAPLHPSYQASIGLMSPAWKLEERVEGLLDPKRNLSPNMNTKTIVTLIVGLTLGSVVIAGARVVVDPQASVPAPAQLTARPAKARATHSARASRPVRRRAKTRHSTSGRRAAYQSISPVAARPAGGIPPTAPLAAPAAGSPAMAPAAPSSVPPRGRSLLPPAAPGSPVVVQAGLAPRGRASQRGGVPASAAPVPPRGGPSQSEGAPSGLPPMPAEAGSPPIVLQASPSQAKGKASFQLRAGKILHATSDGRRTVIFSAPFTLLINGTTIVRQVGTYRAHVGVEKHVPTWIIQGNGETIQVPVKPATSPTRAKTMMAPPAEVPHL